MVDKGSKESTGDRGQGQANSVSVRLWGSKGKARDPGRFRLLSLCAPAASTVSLILPQCPFLAPEPKKYRHKAPLWAAFARSAWSPWVVPPALASGIFHEREEVGRRGAERGELERKERGGLGRAFGGDNWAGWESRKERGDRGGHVWVCDLEGGVSSPRDRKMGRVV